MKQRNCEEMERALKVIRTWAAYDYELQSKYPVSQSNNALNAEYVKNLCDRVLEIVPRGTK